MVAPASDSFPAPLGAVALSIVVPTRDRPEGLTQCLAALARQTVASRLEVVVVDDAKGDATAVRAIAERFGARLIRLEGHGPAAARNAGARAAAAPVVCFTDDDCRPQPEWAERLARGIARGSDVTAGRTLNGSAGNRFAEASQTVANHLMVPAGPALGGLLFATSNNLACRAKVIRALPFDEGYRTAGGEDREWCAQLRDRGLRLDAEPAAIVLHHQRLDLAGFLRQHARYGRGAYRYRARRATARRLEPPAFYLGLVRAGFRSGPATGALVCVAQLATAVGFFAERRGARQAASR